MRQPRRLLWLAGLLVPLLGVELALRLLAPALPSPDPWPSVGHEVKVEFAERLVGEQLDLLVLGSSVSEAGIDPALLESRHGISAFNAAGPFSTPIGMEAWMDQGLWALEPETLVIGLPIWGAPDARSDDVLARGFEALDAHGHGADHWLVDASEFWRRRGQLRSMIDLVADSVDRSSYTPRGHLTFYRGMRNANGAEDYEGSPFPGFSAENQDALGALARVARQRGIRVVLLLEPGGCPEVLAGCANTDSEKLALAALTELAQRFDVEMINGREMPTQSEWFADGAHFNELGAAAFTDHLAGQLLALD